MNKINVVGIGPGNPSYILPAALDVLRKSEIIIGGERNLSSIDLTGKETITIKDNLKDIIEYIKKNAGEKKISVVASGDPGFYGILGYLGKYFSQDQMNIIPGVSSVQYMFAKLGISWEDACLGSLHGRDEDILDKVKEFGKAAFLTDNDRSYKYIAEILSDNGYGDRTMCVGCNLSYDDELIFKDKAKKIADHRDLNLCVVVILDEK